MPRDANRLPAGRKRVEVNWLLEVRLEAVVVLREVEDKTWPFVVSVIPPEPTEEFFAAFFVKQREILARKQLWVHLCDLRLVAKLPDARIRNMLAEESR